MNYPSDIMPNQAVVHPNSIPVNSDFDESNQKEISINVEINNHDIVNNELENSCHENSNSYTRLIELINRLSILDKKLSQFNK